MTRREEIEQASLDYANKLDISCGDNFGRNLCISLGQSYLQGALWADRTMLDKVCEWIETNTNKINLKGGICLSSKQFIEELKQAMEE